MRKAREAGSTKTRLLTTVGTIPLVPTLHRMQVLVGWAKRSTAHQEGVRTFAELY